MRLDDDSLFSFSIQLTPDIRADIAAWSCKIVSPNPLTSPIWETGAEAYRCKALCVTTLALKRKDLTFYKLVYRHT